MGKVRAISRGWAMAVVATLAVGVGWLAHAAIDNTTSSGTIPYHGTLTSAGQPVTGSVDFCFRLFDGTTALWAEQQTLTVSAGAFATQLGSVTPLPDAAETAKDLNLEVSVVDHAANGPRTCDVSAAPSSDYTQLTNHQPLGATAYALQALQATHAAVADEVTENTYVKTIMRAKFGGASWEAFIAGPATQSCDQICGAVTHPAGCGVAPTCSATWCEGQDAYRTYPPHRDPLFYTSCASTCASNNYNTLSMCMCSLGGCGWNDASLTLPPGDSLW